MAIILTNLIDFLFKKVKLLFVILKTSWKENQDNHVFSVKTLKFFKILLNNVKVTINISSNIIFIKIFTLIVNLLFNINKYKSKFKEKKVKTNFKYLKLKNKLLVLIKFLVKNIPNIIQTAFKITIAISWLPYIILTFKEILPKLINTYKIIRIV